VIDVTVADHNEHTEDDLTCNMRQQGMECRRSGAGIGAGEAGMGPDQSKMLARYIDGLDHILAFCLSVYLPGGTGRGPGLDNMSKTWEHLVRVIYRV
jgi:hypothetical protein